MHQQSVVLLGAGVGVVVHACQQELLIWARVEDHYHWYDPPGHPRAPEAPHRRRYEHWHCYCPPLQPMSLLLLLRRLVPVLLLVLLQGLSRQVVELAGRWSGEDRLV